MDDNEGHLFGGLSQGSVDLGAQKEIVKERIEEQKQQNSQEMAKEDAKHPACKLLDDGSGYMLFDAKDVKLYKNNETKPLQTSVILFN